MSLGQPNERGAGLQRCPEFTKASEAARFIMSAERLAKLLINLAPARRPHPFFLFLLLHAFTLLFSILPFLLLHSLLQIFISPPGSILSGTSSLFSATSGLWLSRSCRICLFRPPLCSLRPSVYSLLSALSSLHMSSHGLYHQTCQSVHTRLFAAFGLGPAPPGLFLRKPGLIRLLFSR